MAKTTINKEEISIPDEDYLYFRRLLRGEQTSGFPKDKHLKKIALELTSIMDLAERSKTFEKLLNTYELPAGSILERVLEKSPVAEKPTTWADMEKLIGPISWRWRGWLPNGFVTLLVGESGMCKSQVALHIAKCCTTGEHWPDGTSFNGEPGTALWGEAESAQALNLSNGKAWDISLERFYTPFKDPMMAIELDKIEHQAEIERLAFLPEVKIIIVDSLRGAQRKDENSSEAAQCVFWLASLAMKTGKPVLLLHHLNKPPQDETGRININRIRGSSAIVQPARVIWAVDKPDPQSERRRLYVIKNNLCKFAPPIGITITDYGLQFCDSPREPRKLTLVDRGKEFLQALLSEKPLTPKEIFDKGKDLGFSDKTIRTAAEKLQVVYHRKGFGSGSEYLWSLPSNR